MSPWYLNPHKCWKFMERVTKHVPYDELHNYTDQLCQLLWNKIERHHKGE